jgi:hypothetical protein
MHTRLLHSLLLKRNPAEISEEDPVMGTEQGELVSGRPSALFFLLWRARPDLGIRWPWLLPLSPFRLPAPDAHEPSSRGPSPRRRFAFSRIPLD